MKITKEALEQISALVQERSSYERFSATLRVGYALALKHGQYSEEVMKNINQDEIEIIESMLRVRIAALNAKLKDNGFDVVASGA